MNERHLELQAPPTGSPIVVPMCGQKEPLRRFVRGMFPGFHAPGSTTAACAARSRAAATSGATGWFRRERVLGPVVLRVTGSEVLTDVEVRGSPEALEVARDLHGTLGRRKEVQGEWYAAAEDRRGHRRAEHLLEADRSSRSYGIVIVDPNGRTGGRGEVRRSQPIELGAPFPRKLIQESGLQVDTTEISRRTHGAELMQEGWKQRVEQRCIGDVGPRWVDGVQEAQSVAEALRPFGPGQHGESTTTDFGGQRFGDGGRLGIAYAPFGEYDGAEATSATRHEARLVVPFHDVDLIDLAHEVVLDIRRIQRCREEDAALGGTPVRLRDDDEACGGERVIRRQHRARTVALNEASLPAGTALCDAVGICQSEHAAGVFVTRDS